MRHTHLSHTSPEHNKKYFRSWLLSYSFLWTRYLKWIELAYNTTPHASHGFTPFLLMFGREAKLPVQVNLPKIDTKGWQTTVKSYLSDFLNRLAEYQKQVMINKMRYQLQMKANHDKNVLKTLEPGSKVLRQVPAQFRSKLDLPKDGPWQVKEQRVKDGQPLPVYKVVNEQNRMVLAHRESLSKFVEPLFQEGKEEKAKKGEDKHKAIKNVESGPASRTRAKAKVVMALLGERKRVPELDERGIDVERESDNQSEDDDEGDDDEERMSEMESDDYGGDDDSAEPNSESELNEPKSYDDGEDDDDNDDDEGNDGFRGAHPPGEYETAEEDCQSESNSADQFAEISSPQLERDRTRNQDMQRP